MASKFFRRLPVAAWPNLPSGAYQRPMKKIAIPYDPARPHEFAHLATWRERADLTQEQVSEIFGVSAVTIHRWETGKAPVTVRNFSKLATLYGANSVAELMFHPSAGQDAADLKEAYEVLRGMSEDDRAAWIQMGRRLRQAPPETSPKDPARTD